MVHFLSSGMRDIPEYSNSEAHVSGQEIKSER